MERGTVDVRLTFNVKKITQRTLKNNFRFVKSMHDIVKTCDEKEDIGPNEEQQ